MSVTEDRLQWWAFVSSVMNSRTGRVVQCRKTCAVLCSVRAALESETVLGRRMFAAQ